MSEQPPDHQPAEVPVTNLAITLEHLARLFNPEMETALPANTPVVFKRYSGLYPITFCALGFKRVEQSNGKTRDELHVELTVGPQGVEVPDVDTPSLVVIHFE